MATPAVVIYSSTFCPYCSRAKQLLERKGVSFEEISVDWDAGKRKEMMERAHGRHTVPQIFIGDHHVGGCDELYALERRGELEGLLSDSET